MILFYYLLNKFALRFYNVNNLLLQIIVPWAIYIWNSSSFVNCASSNYSAQLCKNSLP